MRNFTLSIPKPCSEKWDSFTKTRDGGFCQRCNKTVVDFTMKSEREIAEAFASAAGPVCGKFRPNQLHSYTLQAPRVRPGMPLFKAGLAAMVLLFLSRPAAAQEPTKKQRTEINDVTSTHQHPEPIKEPVRGRVIDKLDHSALPGISVVVKGTQTGTVTDANGEFQLGEVGPGDVLVFTFIGYTPEEFVIPKKMESLNIEMCMDMDITGEVAVEGVYENPTALQRTWRRLKGVF